MTAAVKPASEEALQYRVLAATRSQAWSRAALSFGSGAISVLAFAPFFAWPVLFLTLPGVVLVLDGIASQPGTRRPIAKAAATGWWFGFGFFVAGLFWIGSAFFVEAEKFLWALPLAVAGLPAVLALFYAAAFAAAATLWRPGPERIVVFAASIFAVDWLRGHILTGFPWNIFGYALTSNDALMQSASLFGVYGLGFFAVLICASPAAFSGVSGKGLGSRVLVICCALLLAGAWLWGQQRLSGGEAGTVPGVKLRIVQANIPQAEKWRPESRDWIFQRYLDLSRSGQTDGLTHIIWPESSVPFLFMADEELHDSGRTGLIRQIVPPAGSIVLGAERAATIMDGEGKRRVSKVYNSLFAMDASGSILAVYDKNHLVPFGEYIPFAFIFRQLGLKNLTHQAEGFAPGVRREPIGTPHAPLFAPLICYEIIFPGASRKSGGRVRWMLNLTNDAWFGETTGPYQHLQQARVRAVEEGVPVIRAANTGVSAVIDSHGRIVEKLPLNTQGVIDTALPEAIQPAFFSTSGYVSYGILFAFIFLAYFALVKLN